MAKLDRKNATLQRSLFCEYDERVAVGAHLAAVVKLGEILRLHQNNHQGGSVQIHELERQIRACVQPEVLQKAEVEAADAWIRAMRILSVGAEFTWEELVLVLTLRIELELVSMVMALFGMEAKARDLSAIDFELREVARSSANRRSFSSALQTIRKNWGIPIDDPWTTA